MGDAIVNGSAVRELDDPNSPRQPLLLSARFDEEEGPPAPETPMSVKIERAFEKEEENHEHNVIAYWIMLFLGVGLLLPWNVILNTLDYLNHKHKHFDLAFFATVAYADPQIPLLGIMVKWGGHVSYTKRIISMFFVQAVVLAVMPIGASSTWVTLFLVFILGITTAVLQSSLFGFASQFPALFNQALMSGQGIAGIVASVLRIITKASMSKEITGSAVLYFGLGCAVMLGCIAAYFTLLRMAFSAHHLAKALSPSQPVQVVKHKLQAVSPGDASNALVIPEHPPQLSYMPSLSNLKQTESEPMTPPVVDRWHVFKVIWPMCLVETSVFLMTFSVFPGEIVEVEYHGTFGGMDFLAKNGWWSIILFFNFNIFDTIGRTSPRYFRLFRERSLVAAALIRFSLVPLFVLCVHHATKTFRNDMFVFCLMASLAITNGYFASLGMMYGPMKVKDHEKETAGFMMSFALQLGIVLGAQVALFVKTFN